MTSLIETLSSIRRGQFLELATVQLSKLIREIGTHQGPGEFHIILKFEPKAEGQLVCKTKLKVKSPMPATGDAIFYHDEEGGLERTDPRQYAMDVEMPPANGRGGKN